MNKFILISVCALMALANAQDEPSPMVKRQAPANPLATLQAGLQAFLPENICTPSCGAVCAATSSVCITVPGLVDCKAIKALCDGLCTAGCGCLKKCRNQCQTSNPCPASTGANQLLTSVLCQAKVNTCVTVCQAACPFQTSFGVFQQSLQATFKQFQGFLGGLLAPKAA